MTAITAAAGQMIRVRIVGDSLWAGEAGELVGYCYDAGRVQALVSLPDGPSSGYLFDLLEIDLLDKEETR